MGLFDFRKKAKQAPDTERRAYDLTRWDWSGPWDSLSMTSTATPMGAAKIPAVMACVRIISENIASLSLDVYEQKGPKKIKISDTPEAISLQNPGDYVTSYTLIKNLVASYLLSGNGYATIVREGKKIKLVYQDWRNFQPLKDKEGNIFYFNYSGKMAYAPEDVLHISDFNFNNLTGLSRISLAAGILGEAQASGDFSNKLYTNGVFLGGVIEYDRPLDDSIVQRLRETFNKVYGGVSKAGQVGVIDNGGKFKQFNLAMPLKDAQFLESKKLQIEDIARIFLVPPHKIGHLERATNNNIEQQALEFIQNCLRPIIIALEQELNQKLLIGRPGQYVKLNFESLLRADIKTRFEAYREGLANGFLSINEVRELEDRNPVEGGDQHFIQLNMTTIDNLNPYSDE